MDFDFTTDQQLLRETVRKWIRKDYGFECRRTVQRAGGFSAKAWSDLAELGLLGLQIPEDHGGMGWGPVEAMVVMEELGRGLVLEPYAHGALVAPHLLSFASAQLRQRDLPAISVGEMLVVLAHQERGARYRLNKVTTRAVPSGDAWLLSGTKSVVPAAAFADAFIVPARVAGTDDDSDGVRLFIVGRECGGVEVRDGSTPDGASAAEVSFANCAATLIGDAGAGPRSGLDMLEGAVDVGTAALCAEGVGIMDTLLEITVGYMHARTQFGVPIATFQSLRHRIADIKLQLELARSMSYLATMKLADEASARRRAVSQAKLQLGRSMRFVGQQCLQLHGAVGLTDEYIVSHYFKRLTVIEMTFGDTLHQLGEVSRRMEPTAGVH